VRDVDVVLDPVGGDTTARSWQVLRSGAALVAIAEPPAEGRGGRGDVRGRYFVVRPDAGQVRELALLIDGQQLRRWSRRSSSSPPCPRPSAPSRRAAHPAKSSSASRTGRPAERLPASPADRERVVPALLGHLCNSPRSGELRAWRDEIGRRVS
jgi:hypothetical protein